MRGDIYYGVQFAQSLYLLLWQCGRQDEIIEKVFAKKCEIDTEYEQKKEAEEKWKIDMPMTQYIVPAKDGMSAVGYWTTVSISVNGEFEYQIGRYENEFVCEDEVWKLRKVQWKPLLSAENLPAVEDMHLNEYKKNPKAWLEELPSLVPISLEGITKKTRETITLRNTVLGWMDEYNCATDNKHFVLATSPVIEMNEEGSKAEAFFSVTLIKPCGEDGVTACRGSLYMELKKERNQWKEDMVLWYPYANLEPWKIKGGQ